MRSGQTRHRLHIRIAFGFALLLSALTAAALASTPAAAGAPDSVLRQENPTPAPAASETPTADAPPAPSPTPEVQAQSRTQTWAQALVSDGQFVWGPNVGDFDLTAFLQERGSPLASLANAVEVNAAYYGINPRVLLAVLETRYGLVTALPDGMADAGLIALIEDTSQTLHNAFYDHLYQWGSRAGNAAADTPPAIALADGASLQIADGTSSGSYAVAAALGTDQTPASADTLLAADAAGGFEAVFIELFPGVDPLDASNDINPSSLPPDDLLQFPFPLDSAWRFSGVHSWAGGDYGSDRSSMDFSTTWSNFPNFPYKNTVAAAGGNARIITPYAGHLPCWVEIDHGGGWTTSYYHLRNIGSTSGSIGNLSRNQLIGAIGTETCNGGFASGAHVHFTLWYNGALFDLDGVKLSGWTVHVDWAAQGDDTYNSGYIERDGVTLTPWHSVTNDYQEYYGDGLNYSLRFFGTGADVDRLSIPVVDRDSSLTSGPPIDIGHFDFSLEWWMKAEPGANAAPPISCGANDNWKSGNMLFDRSRGAGTAEWGVSIAGGKLAFGVSGPTGSDYTLCSIALVDDGDWHHILIQRNRWDSTQGYLDGQLWLFVDGVLQGTVAGPTGDVSYPDGAAIPSNCGPAANQLCSDDINLLVGARKYDLGPAYDGWIDDLRMSWWLRNLSNFTPPTQPLQKDELTVGLLSFNEGSGDAIYDTGGYDGGTSNGWVIAGGSPSGPAWTTAVPYIEQQHLYLPLIQR